MSGENENTPILDEERGSGGVPGIKVTFAVGKLSYFLREANRVFSFLCHYLSSQ